MAVLYAGYNVVNSLNPYVSLTVTQGTQSIDGNYTLVSYVLKLHRPGKVVSSASKKFGFTINGVPFSGTYAIGGSGDKTLANGTLTVPHNEDGSKSIACSIATEIGVTWSGTYIGTVTASGTMPLSTIPRATVPTLDPTSAEMGTEITISLPRAVGTFTHDLAYSFAGSDFVTIATDVADSTPWIIPDLSEAIPNAASGTLTIQCITKNNGTPIGAKQYASLTAVVPAIYTPSVSSVRRSEAAAGLAAQFDAYVQGKSKLAVEINGTGASGSTITAYQATLDGVAYTGQKFTTELLTTAGILELKVRVQDSRGRWSDYMSIDVEVLEYSTPKIQGFTVYRSDANGNAKNDGEYLTAALQYSVSPLGGKNTARAVVSYDQAPADGYTALLSYTDLSMDRTVTPTGKTFTTDSQFDLQLVVTDWFGATATSYALLPTADVVFDVSADGSAISFGKVSEVANSMEVARDALFHNPAEFREFAQFPASYGGGHDEAAAMATLAEVGGGRLSVGAGTTGVLTVLLPQDFNGTMISFDVDIYSYAKQTLATYSFAGQLAKNSSTGVYRWSSPSYHVRGAGILTSLPISFGRHGGMAAVSIGTDETDWSLCTVAVRNVKTWLGEYYAPSYWQDGWSIQVSDTALTEIMNTYENPAGKTLEAMGLADRTVEIRTLQHQVNADMDPTDWTVIKFASGLLVQLSETYLSRNMNFSAMGNKFVAGYSLTPPEVSITPNMVNCSVLESSYASFIGTSTSRDSMKECYLLFEKPSAGTGIRTLHRVVLLGRWK